MSFLGIRFVYTYLHENIYMAWDIIGSTILCSLLPLSVTHGRQYISLPQQLNTLDIHAESPNYSDNWKLRVKLGVRWGSSLNGRVTRSMHCIWNQKIIGWKSTDSAVVLKDLVQLGAY